MKLSGKLSLVGLFFFGLTACQSPNISKINILPEKFKFFEEKNKESQIEYQSTENSKEPQELNDLLKHSLTKVELNKGFSTAISSAVISDPTIISSRERLSQLQSGVSISMAEKDFQFSGTVYGGAEDVSDEVVGLALVLNANRLIYDGGKLDARITSEILTAESAEHAYLAQIDQRAAELAKIWVDLERFETLNGEINGIHHFFYPQ